MMVETSTLTGPALDWAVAKADENLHPKGDVRLLDGKVFTIEAGDYERSDRWQLYDPSTSWAQGGSIIERENISVGYQGHLGVPLDSLWYATNRADACGFGQTPLIAAMRCYVASKLGNQINVPEELL